ncbi:hypothetical protein ACFQ0T_11560 [Kitasatospora gansuensis]
MNGRVLGIELRRSAAPWPGVLVLAGSLAVFCLIDGIWWRGTAGWTAQWTSMALWTRSLLGFWWPLVVGLGAVYGLRDSRSRMTELLSTTPRPAWRRAALPAGAMAVSLVAGFGLLVLVGGVQVGLGATSYLPLGWLPISLVAALSLVAGALLGMGVARALPSVLTPPGLAVFFLAMTGALLRQNNEGLQPSGHGSNRLGLLSPTTVEPREMLLTLSGSVHLGQTLWLLGLLATGFALLVAVSRRARLLAVVPVLAGAALAMLILPAAPRDTYVVDRAAASPVCDGPVCVTEANRSRLPELASSGREALRVLHEVLGDQAPTSVREDTTLRVLGGERLLAADMVLVDFDERQLATATGKDLTRALIAQGLAPNCGGNNDREGGERRRRPAEHRRELGAARSADPAAGTEGQRQLLGQALGGRRSRLDEADGTAAGRAAYADRRGARRRPLLRALPAAGGSDRGGVPMRWLTLYARSRQVPLSAALVALVTLLVRFLVDGGVDGSGTSRSRCWCSPRAWRRPPSGWSGRIPRSTGRPRSGGCPGGRRTCCWSACSPVRRCWRSRRWGRSSPPRGWWSGPVRVWSAWPRSGPRCAGRSTRGPCRPAGSRWSSSPRRCPAPSGRRPAG